MAKQVVGRPKKVNREEIVAAALQVMEKEGFAALSMRSLARELGINHATIYNYFENIEDVEREALAGLMTSVPMPDRENPAPLRQQLIQHLLAVREIQLVYPKLCHAPAGTPTWRLHMNGLVTILKNCCTDEEQFENAIIAYNALIGVVATSAERTRTTGRKIPIIHDMEAVAALPQAEFEPLLRPVLNGTGYSRRIPDFVFRLDYLIDCLMPQLESIDESILISMQEEFSGQSASESDAI